MVFMCSVFLCLLHQAFGIGALEDEDPEEDIYATDSWSRYDRVLGGEEEGKGAHSWTAPRKSRFSKYILEPHSYYHGSI